MLELDYRQNDFVSVTLMFDEISNQTFIDLEVGEDLSTFPVAPESAWDAFCHPFVYEPIDRATARMLAAMDVAIDDAVEIPFEDDGAAV